MTFEAHGVARESRTSDGASVSANPLLEIRPLTSQADLRACVELQREIWGEDFTDVVPASLLKVSANVGGIVAGAFDAGGSLLGFVYGITGVEDGGDTIVHWSHMLGVTASAQRQGIGRALKEYQRAELGKVGVVTIYWTFDPLVARNAHFNFNVLGVSAKRYVAHMYGEGTSPLHRGIDTDRLIVSWPVNDVELETRRRLAATWAGRAGRDALRIRIPADIGVLQATDMGKAREWRERSRDEFERAFAEGLNVTGFELDLASNSGAYVLGWAVS